MTQSACIQHLTKRQERKRRGQLFVTEAFTALRNVLNKYKRTYPDRIDFTLTQSGEDAPEPDNICELWLDRTRYAFYLENKNWTFLNYSLTLLHYNSRCQSCLGFKWKFYDIQSGRPKHALDNNSHFITLFAYKPPNLDLHPRLRAETKKDRIELSTLREFIWYLKRLIKGKLGLIATGNTSKVIYCNAYVHTTIKPAIYLAPFIIESDFEPELVQKVKQAVKDLSS
jgi:hypothetical protein